MEKTLDITGLGEALIEFNQLTGQTSQYLQGHGGDTSNATIAAARAGVRCAYLTRLGGDTFGSMLLKLWADEGVATTGVDTDPQHPTGIYFVTHRDTGHEFSYLRAGSAASRMTPEWLQHGPAADTIRRSHWLHVSGISMGISAGACDTVFSAIELARSAGTRVSLDGNLRLKLWPLPRARACILQAVAGCDLFLPSLEDASALSGLSDPERIVDWAHAAGAPAVVLKLGGEGALVSDGAKRLHLDAHRVPLVDATGAGDCFSGNLLARLSLGDDLFQAARYANAAAALAVQGYGAVAPLPYPQAVASLL